MPEPRPAIDPSPAAPFRSRVRMRYLLLAVFTFVAMVPLCSVAWRLIDGNREALKTSQQEYQHLLASTISREIDIHVAALRAQLIRGSRSLAQAYGRADGGADDTVRRVLELVVDERMGYVRFTDLRGRKIEFEGFAGCPSGLEPAFLAGFRAAAASLADHRDEGAESATHADPILLSGSPKRAALLLTSPVVAGGRFLGVVSAVVDLQSVWDAVVNEHITGHALFAVDAKGHLFASSNLSGVESGRDMADSEIVRRFRDHPGNATETMPFDWTTSRAGTAERYLGSYEVSREGWGVFVQAKESQVYQPVSVMIENTVRWGLLALVSALIAAVVFARVLAKPIIRLAEATRAFARKDFSVRVNERSFITEVGELAERYNIMAAEVEDHIRGLKLAVNENKELFLGTAHALVSAIDAKDPYTQGHSKRVNRYSKILARYHGLTDDEIHDIDVSSLLHDVGKIGVDDAILKKPGQLTPDEFEKMKKHTIIGATIMGRIRQMQRLLPGLRSHHERWTGEGYPDGLKGEGIPLMARIIAVADSFDAMTTNRPYQKAMTYAQAHARLNELKRTAFDEHIVEEFNRAYRAGEFPEPKPQAVPQTTPEPTTV